ncbi:hypothetical protein F3Y22_tig00110467pilonHSYRG00290 [Hibiscus syriacus]|uniref:Pectinesterase inhibitor domain-containing protein n=1 Tax=Hibiscus syriacus TaxID=106335 RepID=A0A6A3AL87_HIBSY|nr:hypothetical protein F3Y22_tig00110467pilonHSYRG00290 [Hibiscus syriacus]
MEIPAYSILYQSHSYLDSLAVMESFAGSLLAVVSCAMKKKRSGMLRRPRVTLPTFTYNHVLMSSPTPTIGCSGSEEQNFKNGSNGFGSESKLKLKLKLGGVMRTIHTNSTADHAFDGNPSLTKYSDFSEVAQAGERSIFLESGVKLILLYSIRHCNGRGFLDSPQPPASAPTIASAPVPTPIPQPSTAASNPRIRTLCSETSYSLLCIRSVAPFFNGKTDPRSVVVMLIKAMTERTKRAIKAATKMAAHPKYSNDPMTVSALKGCREQYVDALVDLKETMGAVLVHEIDTVDTKVFHAVNDYNICEHGFTVTDDLYPLTKINDKLTNLVDIITDLTTRI